MPKNKLFDDNDSEEDSVALKTENEYAKRYDNWREKEELHKLEQKYGDKDLDGPLSSDSEDDDEEPEDMSEEMEAQFLKTLSLLKTKDPRIYDPNYKFFDAAEENKSKEEEDKNEEIQKPKKQVDSLAAAFADSDDDEDDSGEIFKVEKKASEPQKTNKEAKIKQYLSGASEQADPEDEKDLAPLRALWSDPAISRDEAFLRDYILNKRYLEADSAAASLDATALAADEALVEEQGRFERAYNFRFEEPDQEYIKRYPRTMASTRPKDDSRAKKRAEVKTRKEEEKQRKMEEIARLKALKLKEIQEKLAKIKEVTGNDELAFKDEDIEGDFDPAEHDRRMRAIFDEQYYGDADDEKPVFPDLDEELEIENWEDYDEEAEDAHAPTGDGPHCEDDDFNMDADYDPKRARTTLLEEIKETLGKKRRNRKKKSKLAKLLETEKPKFIPDVTDKTYDRFMEEYYKMDCEDVIGGDLPTRFKYRETVPNNFGLTIEEILLADDKELNKWASLKKTVKHRPSQVELSEVKTYEAKAADLQLKRKLLPSLFKDLPEEPKVVVPIEGKKKKKKKNKNKSAVTTEKHTEAEDNKDVDAKPSQNGNAGEKKNKKNKHKENTETPESDEKPQESSNDKDVNKVTQNKKKNKQKPEKSKDNVNKSQIENNDDNTKETKSKTQNPVQKQNGITITKNDTPNKKKKNKQKPQDNDTKAQNANKLKRKLEPTSNEGPANKKNKSANKKNNKNKNKPNQQNNKKSNGKEDILSKLSDERLKAYGLNPKKYRSFLKYKKY